MNDGYVPASRRETPAVVDETAAGSIQNVIWRDYNRLVTRSPNYALNLLAILAALFSAHVAAPVVVPLVVAILISLILLPVVNFLHRSWLPRLVVVLVTAGVFLSLFVAGAVALSVPAAEWLDRAPQTLNKLEQRLKQPMERVQSATRRVEELAKLDDGLATPIVVESEGLLQHVIGAAPVVLGYIVVLIILIIFLLSYGPVMIRNVVASLTDEHAKKRIRVFFARTEREVSRYLLTITAINTGLGIAAAAILALLDFPNPLLWGAMVGLFNFAPYVGPAIAVSIIAIVSLITFEGLLPILVPPLAVGALTVTEGQLITPLILGRRLTLNPLLIFVWIMFWTWMWGIPGALIATPMLVCLRIISTHYDRLKPLAALMK